MVAVACGDFPLDRPRVGRALEADVGSVVALGGLNVFAECAFVIVHWECGGPPRALRESACGSSRLE